MKITTAMPGRQRGIALPVMLIVLAVMLISGAFLLKSSNITTLTTANMAYQSSLNKANDRALLLGAEWLNAAWTSDRTHLESDDFANAYMATFDPTQNVHSGNFWTGSKQINDGRGNTIEYVIHRLCAQPAPWNDPGNSCMQTTPNTATPGTTLSLGASMKANAPILAGSPQLHYVITARIYGPRGGNVISQLAVLIGV